MQNKVSQSQASHPVSYRDQLIKAQLHKKHHTSIQNKIQHLVLSDRTLHKKIRLDGNTIEDTSETHRHDSKTNLKLLFQYLSQTDKIHQWKGYPRLSLHIDTLDKKAMKNLSDFLLKDLKKCRSLHLYFRYLADPQSSTQLKDLAFRIPRRLPNLKDLNLTIKFMDHFPQDNFQFVFRHLTHHLSHLDHFAFTPPMSYRLDPVAILSGIKRSLPKALRHIKSFNLSIPTQDFQNDLQVLKTPQNTLDFFLDLSYTNSLSDDQFTQIFSALFGQFPFSVSRMVLSLKCLFNLTNNSFITLITSLKSQSLQGLKYLDMDLYGWKSLTDRDLEYFAQEIHHFAALEHLNLSFGDCYKLTDKGTASLLSQICKNLPKLQTLNLNFTKSPQDFVQITDATMQSLAENIKELKALRSLTLNFNGSPEITGQSLKSLAKEINQHLELEALTLSFKRCREITEEDRMNLRQELTGIPNLHIP